MKIKFVLASVLAFVSAGSLYAQQPPNTQAPFSQPKANGGGNQGHDHAEHGPHEGELIEVGKEEYHIELCIDENKKQIVVYLLDKQVKSYVAIDAPFLSVNLKMKGKPVQAKLKPMPQEVDSKGFASSYGLVSPELVDALHDDTSEAKLALKIGNKPYTVKLSHDHDHAGHDHAGHNHAPKKK